MMSASFLMVFDTVDKFATVVCSDWMVAVKDRISACWEPITCVVSVWMAGSKDSCVPSVTGVALDAEDGAGEGEALMAKVAATAADVVAAVSAGTGGG